MPYLEDRSLASGFLDFPSKIQVQTINRCNYQCPMCPYPELTAIEPQSQLDGELFRRLIDQVEAAGRRVKLCLMLQNEPFLDRRFFELLDYAHSRPLAIASISTVSNGSVLSAEMLDRLMGYERFFLTISVNSTERRRYQAVHGRDLWPRIHGMLSAWQGRRSRIRLSFVLDGESLAAGREFRSFWGGLGYATRFVPIFARVDTMQVSSPVHRIDERFGHCHYPLDTLNVLADGGVILCCNDWLHQQQFGNLHRASIAEVWNSPELVRLRRMALEGRLREEAICHSCDYPIRSSQRLALEALLDGSDRLAGGGELPFAAHRSILRHGAGGALQPIFVWSLDAEAGTVDGFVSDAEPVLPGRIDYRLSIGQNGPFNFGSLEAVWCAGSLAETGDDFGIEGLVPVRLELDRQSEEFAFFKWYCEDWKLGDEGSAPGAAEPLAAIA